MIEAIRAKIITIPDAPKLGAPQPDLAAPPARTAAVEAAAPSESAPAPAAEPATPADPPPAPPAGVDRGRAAAAAHKAQMTFARQAAAGNPKIGEKVWMELDADGNPVKVLTYDQAGAAKRKGIPTTWVKNLWSAAN